MKVLVADDDSVTLTFMERALARWGYQPVPVRDGQAALDALRAPDAPPMAILDWEMPGRDGPEVIRLLREEGREAYTFMVLLTARGGTGTMVEGLEAGADEFLAKPVAVRELEVRLRTGRRIVELQRSLIAARDALRIQALRDPLTGLHNRRALLDDLERAVSRAVRGEGDVGALMVDLDHFKRINDQHGHAAGDTVLVEVSRRMQAALRAGDVVGRLGGEEFLAVLPGVGPYAALDAAERLAAAVRSTPILLPSGRLAVTCSVGVASLSQVGAVDPARLVHAADQAVYQAKAAGRDRCRLYTPVEEETARAS